MSGFTPERADITFHADTSGIVASLRSVFDVLLASGGALHTILEAFPDLFDTSTGSAGPDLVVENFHLFFGEAVCGPANGAYELIFNPSDRYLELVSAVASDADVACNFDVHGWPILSVGGTSPTVTEAGGESISARGGAA